MSLYRQPGRMSTRTLVVAAAATLAIGLAGGFAIGRASAPQPTLADKLADLRGTLQPASEGLELTATEYGQAVRDGRVAEPTEYGAAQGAWRSRRSTARRRPTSSACATRWPLRGMTCARSVRRARRRSSPRW